MPTLNAFEKQAAAMVDDANDDSGGGAAHRPANVGAERRKARLAEQLRANLQRRKQQARARRAGDADQRQGLDDDAPER